MKLTRGKFSWDGLGRTPAWGRIGVPERCGAFWDEKQHRCRRLTRDGNREEWKKRLPSWEDGRMPAASGLLCRMPYGHYAQFRTSHRHWLCGDVLPDPQGY